MKLTLVAHLCHVHRALTMACCASLHVAGCNAIHMPLATIGMSTVLFFCTQGVVPDETACSTRATASISIQVRCWSQNNFPNKGATHSVGRLDISSVHSFQGMCYVMLSDCVSHRPASPKARLREILLLACGCRWGLARGWAQMQAHSGMLQTS